MKITTFYVVFFYVVIYFQKIIITVYYKSRFIILEVRRCHMKIY